MRRIELQSLTLENFRSFAKRTAIEFSPTSGLKFITGDNQAQPRLGANGVGKSSLFDGLCWCCTGFSARGLRASDVTTWGAKQPIVSACFLIDGEPAIIERQGSPNRITINDKLCNQADIDRLLGSSRLRFLQSILFGQQVPLFVDLSISERGALLDEVLDMSIWLEAAEHAGKKHAALAKELETANQQIAYQRGRLDGLPARETIEAEAQSWETALAQEVEKAIVQYEALEADLIPAKNKVITTTAAVSAADLPSQLDRTIRVLQKLRADLEADYKVQFASLSKAQEQIKFFSSTRRCPTCNQGISSATVEMHIRLANADITKIRGRLTSNGFTTRSTVEEVEAKEGEYNKLIRKREFLIEQQASAVANLRAQERLLEAAEAAVERIAQSANPHTARLAQLEQETATIKAAMQAAEGVKRRTQGNAIKADFWRQAFRRVRLFLVKRILMQLAIETGNAANMLGLIGWRIEFVTELETKAGTLRPGINIQVYSPSSSAVWEAWSGGEGQRIRLAVTIGLATMIQRLAGVDYGFEVWDEPTAFLSDIGIEDLLECLKYRAEITGKSLWLCDHRSLNSASFAETWMVTKTNEGSSVSLISATEG